jgi:hypothetical protein
MTDTVGHDSDTLGHDDPTTPVKWSDEWWANVAKPTSRRCTAHRRNGGRCGKAAMDGQQVCGTHGGRAPQAKRKAQQRIAEAADRMARELLKMATDENTPEHVKLKAITEALDRAGINAKTSVDVEVALKPFEQVEQNAFAQLEIGSRAAYRRSVGEDDDDADPPALADLAAAGFAETAHDDDGPIDVEVVSEHEYAARVAARPFVNADRHTMTPEDTERQRHDRTASAPGESDDHTNDAPHWMAAAGRPPVDMDQPMTVAEGAEIVADMRAQAAEQRCADVAAAREAGRAVIRQSQRALPRGRS